MRLLRSLSAALLIASAIGGAAHAADVVITNAWFRSLPAGLPAGGYFVLANTGTRAATLSGASSSACAQLMLHRSIETGGMSRMVMVRKIRILPHHHVVFRPGGYHLMCMHPDPLKMKPGSSVAVTLDFTDGTKTATSFIVRNALGR
ncbi:MAG: copper chaperone PCu(A)C [Rhizomicrobium sp.]